MTIERSRPCRPPRGIPAFASLLFTILSTAAMAFSAADASKPLTPAPPAAMGSAVAAPGLAAAPGSPPGIFPYAITTEKLDNGLTLLVVPFETPGVVSYYTLVRAGSRNEVEAGRTGYAHFFEHMMFRGTKKWPEARRREFITSTGSDENGWTTDDYTCYPITTQSTRLPDLIAEEADRFQNLVYDQRQFRTESKAILGEYFKNISNPEAKLSEVIRQTAYRAHTYKHTTMGFVEDIRAMTEGYDYSRAFFDRFYVPANTTVIVVGDVDPGTVSTLVRRHYGSWRKSGAVPAVSSEPPQTEERRAAVEWESPTPRVASRGTSRPRRACASWRPCGSSTPRCSGSRAPSTRTSSSIVSSS